MRRRGQDILRIYETLYRAYGRQHWWPGKTKFEVIVGAILTQNTAWRNVEKAIRNLKMRKLLSLERLGRIHPRELACAIRPAGYYNVKAKRIKSCVDFILSRYHGSLKGMAAVKDYETLRRELLGVHGIGCETADSILLYAFDKPVFVVDAYTKRIFARHGFFREDSRYEDVQKFFLDNLPPDAPLFNEFHALIVKTGKDVCKRKPLCGLCPLEAD